MMIKKNTKQMEKSVQLFRSPNYRYITRLIINTINENNKLQTYLITIKIAKSQNGFQ